MATTFAYFGKIVKLNIPRFLVKEEVRFLRSNYWNPMLTNNQLSLGNQLRNWTNFDPIPKMILSMFISSIKK